MVDDIHESCVLSILECGEHFALGRNILFMSLFLSLSYLVDDCVWARVCDGLRAQVRERACACVRRVGVRVRA